MSRSENVSLTLKERMVSAGSGSLLTSMILTPMDVVRIRLQQQELLPDCSCTVQELTPKRVPNPANVEQLFWQTPCFQELHCKSSSHRLNGTWEAMTNIAKTEGVTTLWRGISITLIMAIPANVVYFTGYEYIRDNSPFEQILPTFNPVICGALARLLAATTVAPFELLKTRLQSIPRSTKSTKSWMMVQDLLKETKIEMQNNGIRALYKGLNITLLRDVPFSAIYWGSYEFCKKNIWIKPALTSTSTSSNNSNWIHFINSFVSGSISGTIAALLTHPFDVGKTRLQISLMNNTDNNTLVKKNTNYSPNMFEFLNTIRKTEGIGALFTGLTPRVAKIAPGCAIMISSYEVSKKFFSTY